ncbi:MAG: DNA mismatch repair endonuclease MutL [Candidatus Symbiothrix sp.]|nr:DNA mismatch repair endonuclease MutL [Candidatus Symbiothrix sp.]
MSDIIHLLSDAIANQIAAGEVIQRPASVVKELMENAVDAGADNIQVVLKKSGTSLIQVIDNGKGMSETDARMAFERHATSKISCAQDLYSIHTFGFRGEALASIAAVAQVELKTRQATDETGTLLLISGSQLERQEPVAMNPGSNFSVKNLFFNIPVRRKFLKSDETELRNILTEFERVALVYPNIAFSLHDDNTEIYSLPASNLKQRIINMMGKKLALVLLPVNVDTSFIRISGFIGAPNSSRKRGALQYFFVNGRYMKHPYFHRAVMTAFEPFIPAGEQPNYFIYLELSPENIDVNIHPSKTEIKFDNEQMLFQMMLTAVKEAIAVPSLEFDREGAVEMPAYNAQKYQPTAAPQVQMRSDYNPFKEHPRYERPPVNWEKFYAQPSDKNLLPADNNEPTNNASTPIQVMSIRGRYLMTTLTSGLTFIDQRRAHIRVLFDECLHRIQQQHSVSQQLLFPDMITFTPSQYLAIPHIINDLTIIGFDLSDLGNHTYSINGIPADLAHVNIVETLREMVEKALETGCEVAEEIEEALALTLARKAAIPYGKILSEEESQSLIAKLFSSAAPNYTPDGKLIMYIMPDDELEKKFK